MSTPPRSLRFSCTSLERELFLALMGADSGTIISAVTSFEAATVMTARRGVEGRRLLDAYTGANAILVVPFDETQARLATRAYARYGKGRGSKAQLNLCDCAAYALARSLDATLLFKGEDFSHTDVGRCV